MSSTAAAPNLARPAALAWLRRPGRLDYYATAEAAQRRDLRVDLLRGFCVFAMVVDHIGGDSWLYAITGGNSYYVSAAEGFIFISGLAMGQAYRGRAERAGLVDAMVEALRRARTLYLATVLLTLIFSALYLYTDIGLWVGREYGLGLEGMDELVVGALTLHYTYHGTDILAMYTLLVLGAPTLFLLLSLGLWRWVLGVSVAWWAAYQQYPSQASLPWWIINGENFPLGAWQVLFVVGLVMGYQRRELAAFLQRWPTLKVANYFLGLAITLGLISIFWTSNVGIGALVPSTLPFAFFDVNPNVLSGTFFKVTLRPWRLIAFAAMAIVLFQVVTVLWRPLRWASGWLLLPLGRHALYSYIVHFFLILLVYNVAPALPRVAGLAGATFDTLLQLAVVAVLLLLVRKRVLFGIVPN
jgi:hypothetical protein